MPKKIDGIDGRKNNKGVWKPGQSGNPKGRPPGLRISISGPAIVDKYGVTPLEFLVAIFKKDKDKLAEFGISEDDVTTPVRIACARDALPYCHKKMPIEVEGTENPIGIYSPQYLACLNDQQIEALSGIVKQLAILEQDDQAGETYDNEPSGQDEQ